VSAEALTPMAQEAIRLAEKATAGPWQKNMGNVVTANNHRDVVVRPDSDSPKRAENNAFIIAARTLVPSQARIILSLVETIKAAPHTFTCASKKYLGGPINSHCDCWKATAFADAMKGE
jgi:hypothetical protein